MEKYDGQGKKTLEEKFFRSKFAERGYCELIIKFATTYN